MLIRESHMVEERGEGKKTKTRETDGWSDRGSALRLHLWKTSFIVEICLQLFGGTSPHCCHIIFSSSLHVSVFLGFFLFSSEG